MTKPNDPNRREVLKNILTGGAAFATGAALVSREEKILAAHLAEASQDAEANRGIDVTDVEVDALSGASRTHTNWAKFADLKKPMSKATLKGLDFSRMVIGSNLINGWAHARDLIYVSDLVKAYHTREKIFATFKMAEACGINTFVGNASNLGLLNDYWEQADSTLRFVVQCTSLDDAVRSLDGGATAVLLQGEENDRWVREGKFDEIAEFVDRVRKEKGILGLGAHRIETIKACVEKGYEPDFWLKTIHHDRYWSRMADKPEHDNVYCRKPEETKEFMGTLPQPWIGFKVLAAGAIHPRDGFRFAFESGADFLCVGMYDFQVVDDVNICMDILESGISRERPWCYT